MLVIPAFAALLFSREKPNRVLCFHGLKFSSVLMVVVFTFLMGPLTTLLNAISMLFVDNAVTDMSGQVLEYPFPVMLFMMAVFGPVCEELVFRGILYRGYLKSGNALKAVLLSSLLFGLIHMNFNQAPYAFALGVSMALLMEATGSLLAPVLMHMVFNAQSVVLMYVYDRFFPWLLEEQAQQIMGPRSSFQRSASIWCSRLSALPLRAACWSGCAGTRDGRNTSDGSGRKEKTAKRKGCGRPVDCGV